MAVKAEPRVARRVIATRPQQQNSQWVQNLSRVGFEVLSIPMLAIEPIESGEECEALKRCILDFDQFHSVIFVSQNAVQYGCDWLDKYWPQPPVKTRFFAIGPKTASALRGRMQAWGATDIYLAEQSLTSEALLNHPLLQQVEGQKLLICRGLGGRTTLADVLSSRGAQVSYCELYRRVYPAQSAALLMAQPLYPQRDILAVFSGETLLNAVELAQQCGLNETILQLTLLVPSERVADQARRLGFTQVLCAANASEDEMLRALTARFIENDL